MNWKTFSFNKKLFLLLVIPQILVWFAAALFYAPIEIEGDEQLVWFYGALYGLFFLNLLTYLIHLIFGLIKKPEARKVRAMLKSLGIFLLSQLVSIGLLFLFIVITASLFYFYLIIFDRGVLNI